jgi:predicted ATPase
VVVAGAPVLGAHVRHDHVVSSRSGALARTSREPLGLDGEQVWPVLHLPLPEASDPPSLERLWQGEAVRLFVERARASRPGFELTERAALTLALACC